MKGFRILKSGVMTSLQDLGRRGQSYFAIPQGGAMDRNSLILANRMLGNPDSHPVLESTLFGPRIEFLHRISIVITGAEMTPSINDYPIQNNRVYQIEKGDVLDFGRAVNGFRSYLGVGAKLKGRLDLGSVSYLSYAHLGNLNGNALKKGDIVSWEWIEKIKSTPVNPTAFRKVIYIKKGPEFDFLSKESKHLITENTYRIEPDSNRMGARLHSNPLHLEKGLKDSLPLLPGFIQLPPSGQAIVILQDGQTTGGYPRIAYIGQEELDSFNQIPIGAKFKFHWS